MYEIQVLLLSLKVAIAAVLISLPFGIYVAWVLEKRQFKGKLLLQCFINLPLVLPPVVIGYVLLNILGRHGWVGFWIYEWVGFSFNFSWWGAALASGIVAFPLMVRSIRASIELLDESNEQAAKTLGASKFKIFLTITLPLMLPGILVGTALAFARSMGEFGATITFIAAMPDAPQTLPVAMFRLMSTPEGGDAAFRLCLIAITISIISLFISELLTRWGKKRMGVAC